MIIYIIEVNCLNCDISTPFQINLTSTEKVSKTIQLLLESDGQLKMWGPRI